MNPDPTVQGDLNTILALLPHLWPADAWRLRLRVIAALACLGLAKLATVTVPVLYKEAVDLVSAGDAFVLTSLIGVLVGYGIARLAQQSFAEFRDFFFARVGQRAIRAVALKTFRHLHSLSLRFHLDRQTGGLSRAIERGVKGIEFLLSFMLFNILPSLLEIVLVCGILWVAFDGWYALVTLVTVGTYIAFTLMVTEWRMKYRRRMNAMDSRANTRAIDSLLNFETVKYFGNEEHEAKRYDRSLRRYEEAAVKSKTTLSLVNIGQGLIVASGLTLVMTMAGFDIEAGIMTVGGFVMVNTYLMQLFLPLSFLGMVYREIKQSLTDMEVMFRLTSEPAEIPDLPGARHLEPGGGDVTFRGVEFGYGRGRAVLRSVSFAVPAGRTVAIVGASGAGKSTIARLLFRFYDVDSGCIEIDGQDIRTVTQHSLRAAIGVVPQEAVLFNDTIFYNIAYGRPAASPAEIEAAARQARIHDFVMSLPDGYNTSVGERGLKLSGGEKQRVAIARTILKRPAIFLFDEATSSLDSHTEQAIQASLADVSANRTTLVIAHRLSTIVDADEIIVLDQGVIAERGDHQSLLGAAGHYAGMWHEQQRRARELADTEVPAQQDRERAAVGTGGG